ncbi:hypothetical protein IG631_19591 [Alternaria alternata]|nr:hypothetical protein IG631_19591 [Alternaria alternata]
MAGTPHLSNLHITGTCPYQAYRLEIRECEDSYLQWMLLTSSSSRTFIGASGRPKVLGGGDWIGRGRGPIDQRRWAFAQNCTFRTLSVADLHRRDHQSQRFGGYCSQQLIYYDLGSQKNASALVDHGDGDPTK